MFPKLSRFFFSVTHVAIFLKSCAFSLNQFSHFAANYYCSCLPWLCWTSIFHLTFPLWLTSLVQFVIDFLLYLYNYQLLSTFDPLSFFFLFFFSSYFFNQESKSQQVDFSVIRILSLHPTQAEIPQDVPYLYAAIIFTDKNCPIDFLLKLKDH